MTPYWYECEQKIKALEKENERLKVQLEGATLLLSLPSNARKSSGCREAVDKWLKEYGKEEK